MADEQTLRFYADNAVTYVDRARGRPNMQLQAFLAALPPGAQILELGTGGGDDAHFMLVQGFDVEPTDASSELAKEAEARIGRPVRIMRFDELAERDSYDGVWASACLLHAPIAELTDDLALIHQALRPGGLFVASFKAGNGEGRDQFGRYYNYPDRAMLEAHYISAAPWAELAFTERLGSGYDNQPTLWHWVTARKSTLSGR
jgi:SAM-dependent methyltransferase